MPLSLLVHLGIQTKCYFVFFRQVKLMNLRENERHSSYEIWPLYYLQRNVAKHVSLLVLTHADAQQGLYDMSIMKSDAQKE